MTRRTLSVAAAVLAVIAVIVLVAATTSGPDAGERGVRADLPVATVLEDIDVGGEPVAVAVGAGYVWVLDAGAGKLSRIDPRTRRIFGPRRRVEGGPFAVAVGDGLVWVASTDGSIRAFDARSVRPSGPVARVRGANGLAVGAGGVWVTSRLARTLTRIDPATRRADRPIRVGAGPADVAVGAGGVWVANADDGTVTRIDPRTSRVAPPIRVGAPRLRALTFGENAVWVVRARGQVADRLQVVRIDPEKRQLTGDPVRVTGAVPIDIAAAGGSIWVTDVGGLPEALPGGVTRIDPRTQRLVGRPLRTGSRPTAVAAQDGWAWVANAGDGTLTPIQTGRR